MNTDTVQLAPDRRLSLWALISVAFFTTCGGAYALEPLVGAVGPGWAFALLFLTPLLWSVPIALMVAELSTLIPEEGGYYIWVREALGPFWAVQEGWWTIGSSLGAIWCRTSPRQCGLQQQVTWCAGSLHLWLSVRE